MKKLISILAALLVGSQAFAQAAPGGNVGVAIASDGTTVSFLNLDAGGNLKVSSTGGGGGTSSSFGSAFPATGTALGISNGTNMVALVLGQSTKSASLPVSLASDQGALAVTATQLPVALGQQGQTASLAVALANEDVQDLYLTGQATQTATVNNILPATAGTAATDVTGYKAASVQVVSTGTGGTFIFEGSNDNSNFQSIPVYNQLILTGTPITSAVTANASQIIYTFPVQFRYVRLRIATTITGGSIQAFSTFKQSGWSPATFAVTQGTAANLNTTATIASGTVTTVSTVTTCSTLTALTGGGTAVGVAIANKPVTVGGAVLSTVPAAAIANTDVVNAAYTGDQQLIVHLDGDAANEWTSTSGTTPLASASSTQLQAAAGSGIRHYVTGIQVYNNSATGGTCSILDGSTVIWTIYLPANTINEPNSFLFRTSLKGTAATALNIQLSSASMSVYYNVQGYNNN